MTNMFDLMIDGESSTDARPSQYRCVINVYDIRYLPVQVRAIGHRVTVLIRVFLKGVLRSWGKKSLNNS